ncbi:gene transfer agent family protein [Agrobacterium vitis]|uniref:gene transfer agent family protein n=1 Tax=Agrobacterium vitis TaxID=373 RepID=UPI003D2CD9B1
MNGRTLNVGKGMRANRRRGEVEAVIDGERRILCLTLGALAELETAFAADSLADLALRFSSGKLSSRDLIRILAVGLRGGGNCCADEDVADMCVEGGLAACVAIVRELLLVTFGTSDQSASAGQAASIGEGDLARP